MNSEYAALLDRKRVRAQSRGCEPGPMPAHLFPFQRHCVEFGVRAGCWGLYLDTGLGKTACELEWSRVAAEKSNGMALILAPLAVAQQIAAEGRRWGYDSKVIRSQTDAGGGINVCNYDRLHLIEPSAFGSVALDESSILKAFTGKVSRALIDAFSGHRWKMCATATPAPNDHTELATQAEFVGAMTRDEMMMRFFVHDSADTKTWRLKGHARSDFWAWLSTWSRMASHPSDLGDDVHGYDLPPLVVHRHEVDHCDVSGAGLFGNVNVSATELHSIKRQTIAARSECVAELTNAGTWVVWCDTNYEADALARLIPDAAEVRGSDSIDKKEETLAAFSDGSIRVLISKPSICGHGLNWQHCSNVAYVGRSFSYEAYYQSVRRCWRFGQKNTVNVYLIVAPGEDEIGRVIQGKADDHGDMKREMIAAMASEPSGRIDRTIPVNTERKLPQWIA